MRRFFRLAGLVPAMHDAHDVAAPEEPVHGEVPAPEPEPPTAGEWAIGAVFVLAAIGLVAWIAWSIAAL